AHDLFLGRADGHDDQVVLILPVRALTLGDQRSNYRKGHLANTNRFPDGILTSEKIVDDGFSQHRDLVGGPDILSGEGLAFRDANIPDGQVLRRYAVNPRTPVIALIYNLLLALLYRRSIHDAGAFVLDRGGIVFGQGLRAAVAS